MPALFVVLLTHWMFDFVLQSRWMAHNKSSYFPALLLHVAVYTVGLIVTITVLQTCLPLVVLAAWVTFNSVAHLITDFITSRINSYLWRKNRVHDFFVSVGFDQLIHYATLFGSLYYITNT